ncbi:hypothetical protein TWF281_009526 [Arthrobotrys megalospora]
MKWLLKAMRKKHTRKAVQSGLNVSATMPTSGSTAIDNSTGASNAAAELSARLGTALDQLDVEGNIRGQLTEELDRLDTKVSGYANSQLSFCTSAQPWECERSEAEIISLAWDCALNVYELDPRAKPLDVPGIQAKVEVSISPSNGGSTKATTCTVFTPSQQPGNRTNYAPYIFIAIRGTCGTLDNVVNLNGEPRDTSALFHGLGITFDAHAGFLNSALQLIGPVSSHVESFLKRNPRANIFFTGHSAGGAVASLLHLAVRLKFGSEYTGAIFSRVTFGTPPVARYTSPSDKLVVEGLVSSARVLNIVNEFDLIARADKKYMASLIELYNTPLPIDIQSGTPVWELPEPELQHIGPIVVLKTGIPQASGLSRGLPGPTLSAWKISPDDLGQLVFCRLSVHSRVVYRDRLRQIREGRLNEGMEWY